MLKIFLNLLIPIIALSLSFIPTPVSAERPMGAGNHKAGKQGQHKGRKHGKNYQNYQDGNQYRGGGRAIRHFDNRQRTILSDYFRPRFQSGRCPPGLAKKYNGCMPPGQAKKWRIGYPLPQGVTFYDLPPHLIGQLGYPGPGYRYVRVAADVLLIAAGTGMVLAAVEDLNGM